MARLEDGKTVRLTIKRGPTERYLTGRLHRFIDPDDTERWELVPTTPYDDGGRVLEDRSHLKDENSRIAYEGIQSTFAHGPVGIAPEDIISVEALS